MTTRVISVSRDFSPFPGPRYIRQGENSGEKFRRLLVSALDQSPIVVVDLDGTRGFGSSFLDEAFGGLVRAEGMSTADVLRRVEIRSEQDQSYREEAIQSIKDAKRSESL
ncbi:MAG: STAS-like domain-containing protein [Alphaproteobacteria bacterium]|nr:STAS-like domain-containing protein [Alphaproteobacteria bacterium]